MHVVEPPAHQRRVDPAASVGRQHTDPRDPRDRDVPAAGDGHPKRYRGRPADEDALVDRHEVPVERRHGSFDLDLVGPDRVAEGDLEHAEVGVEVFLGSGSDLDVHGGSVPAARAPTPGVVGYSSGSMPTVSPCIVDTARTAIRIPGMKEDRSVESWRIVRVSPGEPNRTSW